MRKRLKLALPKMSKPDPPLGFRLQCAVVNEAVFDDGSGSIQLMKCGDWYKVISLVGGKDIQVNLTPQQLRALVEMAKEVL